MNDRTPLARLAAVMNAVGTCLIFVIMAVMLIDVGGRFLFNDPFEGTAEIVAMSISAIVFLQFPSTLRAGRVINTDGFLGWIGARSIRAEQWLLGVYHLIGAAMFVVVTVYVWPLARAAWASDEFYGNIGVFTFPKWPVFFVIAFGSGVMALQYLTLAAGYASAGWRRQRLIDIDPATRVLS